MAARIAVVIPCYRVTSHILEVIDRIGPLVERIYVVDDGCPDRSGLFVQSTCHDMRVTVLHHENNCGVGAAVITGYRQAIEDGMEILVKIDGDGQMDPRMIARFTRPIETHQADYTKGNRFHDVARLGSMPTIRLLGNAILSLFAKMSTGYWNVFDINNGYTAIHARVVRQLDLDKVSCRYFFETDMLFRLNLARALVRDIPMDAVYGSEVSHLRVLEVAPEFLLKHTRNFFKRLIYNYVLRDMSVASIQLFLGGILFLFGAGFGGYHWWLSLKLEQLTPTGTIMIAMLSLLSSLQMLLAFISFDIASVPQRCIHEDLDD